MSTKKRPFSPVDEFIKTFNEMSARYSRNELWYNYIDMHAIALANTCDSRCRDTREEQYNAIVQKYDEKTVNQFAVLTGITMTALLENPEQDFLGTVYQNLGLTKSRARAVFHAVQCRADDGTHEYAGFFRSGQVAHLPSKRPMLRCRMSASGWVQCDARAVRTH